MPIYDYRCEDEDCGHVFSKIKNVSNRESPQVCPHCGADGKLVTAPKASATTKNVANVFRKV